MVYLMTMSVASPITSYIRMINELRRIQKEEAMA